MKLVMFLVIWCGISFAHAAPIEVSRVDGSKIRFYLEKPSATQFPLIILLHGSTCTSSLPLIRMAAPAFLKRGIAVVTLEKYGLNEGTANCPKEYLQNNTISGRILDHLQVVSYLRANLSGWNRRLGWAGGSEGGQVASLTAPLVPETKILAILASGGGMTMAEELPLAMKKRMRREGASEKEISTAVAELKKHYGLIRANPTPKREWLSDGKFARNTYKYWDSILWIKALPLLERLNASIYVAHGTEDTSVPIESSDQLAERFKKLGKGNLTYVRYPGLEHDWSDLNGRSSAEEVMTKSIEWIISNL